MERLRALASDGVLPKWSSWFGEDAMGELVRRYPDTPYAADARLKTDLINDHLAGREMDIGRFYERRHEWRRSSFRSLRQGV